jgi:hypothetical protein
VARKLLVQVWHVLHSHPPLALESNKSLTLKLHKLAVTLGRDLRKTLGLGANLTECVNLLRQRIALPDPPPPCPPLEPA